MIQRGPAVGIAKCSCERFEGSNARTGVNQTHNKALKKDCKRVAFSVPIRFCG